VAQRWRWARGQFPMEEMGHEEDGPRIGWSLGAWERDLEWWADRKKIVFGEAEARLSFGEQAKGSNGKALRGWGV
jgi:hypothetical protein